MSENQLLHDFASTRSESAFEAIVRLHLNMVFATALRQVGDRGLAEEITQSVFLTLAGKAPSLKSNITLGGWLYRTTINQCRDRLRSELRRRHREEFAAQISAIVAEGDSVWSSMLPLLDEALLSLQEKDRLAVILHFMEEQTFSEVGRALGVGEDAARKRVHRVVEDLGRWFQKRGIALPAGGLAAALTLPATQAAPPALGASIVAVCCAVPAASLFSLAAILMASTKTKIAIGLALLALGVTVPIALHEPPAEIHPGAPLPTPQQQPPAPRPQLSPTATAAPAKTIFQRINEGDNSMSMLAHDQAEAFLQRNKTNAESLLIAYRVTHDTEYLRKALAAFPTNSAVLFRAIIHDAAPENRRALLDQFKQADPNNALPAYLSAADHLKNGQIEDAYKDLQDATQRGDFRDDITEQIINLEEIYLAAGYTPAEAKALGMAAVEMPHISQLVKLSKSMNELVTKFQTAGDNNSAERLAQMGLDISARLRQVQDGGNLLGEIVSVAVERNFLRQLDPAKSYNFVNGAIPERLKALDQSEQSIRGDAQFMEKWLNTAPEPEIINYFDRLKLYGESAALAWLKQRSPE